MVDVVEAYGTWCVRVHGHHTRFKRPALDAPCAALEIEPMVVPSAVVPLLRLVRFGPLFRTWLIARSDCIPHMPNLLRFATDRRHKILVKDEALRALVETGISTWINSDWHLSGVLDNTTYHFALVAACVTATDPGALTGVPAADMTALVPRCMRVPSMASLRAAILRGDIRLVDTRVSLPNGTEFMMKRARGAPLHGIRAEIHLVASTFHDVALTHSTLWIAGRRIKWDDDGHTLEELGVDDDTPLDLRDE